MASSTREHWLQRIAQVQASNTSPEQLALMRSRSLERTSSVKAKKARRVHNSLNLASAAWSSNMRLVSSAPTDHATRELGTRGAQAMALLSSPALMRSAPRAASTPLDEEEAEEEALEEELTTMAQAQVEAGALEASDFALQQSGGAAALAPAQQAGFEEALRQLEREPADEAACAAKFELYEGFAKLTEDARRATLDLWAQSAADFDAAPAAKAALQRDVDRIDRPENLGLYDEDPRGFWFVHGMCRQATKNQKLLSAILGAITTRLELLSSQTTCPICLEAFHGTDRPAVTLGCAHKACEECWGHWSAVSGGGRGAICPLCRHGEFVERVLHAAGRGE